MPTQMPTEYTVLKIFMERPTDTIYIKEIYDKFLGLKYTDQQAACIKHRVRVIIRRMLHRETIERIDTGVYLPKHRYLKSRPKIVKKICPNCHTSYTNKIDNHERTVTCPNCCQQEWMHYSERFL